MSASARSLAVVRAGQRRRGGSLAACRRLDGWRFPSPESGASLVSLLVCVGACLAALAATTLVLDSPFISAPGIPADIQPILAVLFGAMNEEALLAPWAELHAVCLGASSGGLEDVPRSCLPAFVAVVVGLHALQCGGERRRNDTRHARHAAFLRDVIQRLITTHFRCEHFWLRTRGR